MSDLAKDPGYVLQQIIQHQGVGNNVRFKQSESLTLWQVWAEKMGLTECFYESEGETFFSVRRYLDKVGIKCLS